MALCESIKVAGSYIFDTPFIYHAGRNVASGDQFPQPRGSLFVKFVVIRRQSVPSPVAKLASPPADRTRFAHASCATSRSVAE